MLKREKIDLQRASGVLGFKRTANVVTNVRNAAQVRAWWLKLE